MKRLLLIVCLVWAVAGRHPVVLVPGLMASVMEGHLEGVPKTELPSLLCARSNSGWDVLWVKISNLLPWSFSCLMHYLSVKWENNMTPVNQAGVSTRLATGRSGLAAIDQLDTTDTLVSSLSNMYHVSIVALKKAGFVEGRDLFGLGSDWRHVPSSDWIAQLKSLVENAYALNSNSRVVLVGHSLGCPYTFSFLHQQTLEWRKQYIEMYMPVAPVFTGTGMATYAMLGKAFLGWPTPFKDIGEVARTFPSMFLLTVSNPEAQVIVKTNKYVYTSKNISELLLRAGIPWAAHGINLRDTALSQGGLDTMEHPGVPVTIFWSKGIPTIKSVRYLLDSSVGVFAPLPVFGDGDGLVELGSLKLAYDKWTKEGNSVSKVVMEDAVNHLAIISDKRFVNVLVKVASWNSTWSDAEFPINATIIEAATAAGYQAEDQSPAVTTSTSLLTLLSSLLVLLTLL